MKIINNFVKTITDTILGVFKNIKFVGKRGDRIFFSLKRNNVEYYITVFIKPNVLDESLYSYLCLKKYTANCSPGWINRSQLIAQLRKEFEQP